MGSLESMTVPRLCAKFEALNRTFNEVSSRLSVNGRKGNHVSEKRFCIFKLIKLRFQRYFDSLSQKGFRLLFITSNEVDNLI